MNRHSSNHVQFTRISRALTFVVASALALTIIQLGALTALAASQEATLIAGDRAASDYFGYTVAVSSDGNTALVGAYQDDTVAGTDAGSAYVFVRSGTVWIQQAKLVASDGAAGEWFGGSVALAGDTALVGARAGHTTTGAAAGSAYVFVRSGTIWSQQAKLTASDAASGDAFGISVALAGDTALVGAYLDNTSAGTDAGSAYVFVRSGTTWSQQTKLIAADGVTGDRFGCSVAVAGDTALVGAYYDDSYRGSAYVFRFPQYNRLTAEVLGGGSVRLTYVGLPGTNYALDRTFNLKPTISWTPQETNPARADGTLVLTNTAVSATNNFWRMRSVP